LVAYGDTLSKMGDINNAMKYYQNIQGLQMMGYFNEKSIELSEESNDKYLTSYENCQKVQGILNMNYGMYKSV
jgi:hypothetical protein